MNSSDSWAVRLGRGVDAWLIRRGFAAQALRAVVLCELGAGVASFLAASLFFVLPATSFIGFWLFGSVWALLSGRLILSFWSYPASAS